MSAAKDALLSAKRSIERDITFHEREWLKARQATQEAALEADSRAKTIAQFRNDLRDIDEALEAVR